MNEHIYHLPDSWTWVKLGEVGTVVGGGTPRRDNPKYYENGTIPWFTPTDIDAEKILTTSKTAEKITREALNESSARLLPPGTVLFSSRASIGKIAIAEKECATNQGFANIIPQPILESKYLAYGLRNFARNIERLGSGTTYLEVAKSSLKEFYFPLAPLSEQKRIVAKVETLFAESKTAREALDKVPVLLRRFRQSVLAKAFRGELTQRDPNDEPAEKLLERIRQEQKKGKQTFLTEERELPTDLPELPETWAWTTIDEVAEIKMGQSPTGSSYNQDGQGFPLLNGPTEFGREHPTPVQWTTEPTKICNKGDLLICVRGNTTGRMNWADQKYCIGRGLAAISTNSDMVEIRLLFYYLSKETEEIMRRTTGSTFPNLQSNQLRKLPFPLAPYKEQKRLALKIDECFSLADSIETSVKKAREQAERIDQAILTKAFKGELVPQDPDDEPASILLQRLKTK